LPFECDFLNIFLVIFHAFSGDDSAPAVEKPQALVEKTIYFAIVPPPVFF
jgi:hypothetical protein